jgi:hypothetical protein
LRTARARLACLALPAPLAFAAFFAFLAWGQPVTWIGVLSFNCAPSCAINEDGNLNLCLQRSPFAASAEYGPSGRDSSKLVTCTSGTFVNVELVIPALLMNVSPTRSIRTP